LHTLKRLFWHLKNENRPIFWVVSRFLFYTGMGRLITINCGLYKIRFFPSAISLAKWCNPMYGNDSESFLRGILRPNDTVIDVGANIGSVTLAAASLVGQQGRIIAFEPNPRVFKYLRKNIQLNKFKNITAFNFAVGDRTSEVHFSDQKYDDQNKIIPQGSLKIPLRTLDEQFSTIPGPIKLLKVDVEGYEKFVFKGGIRTLTRTHYIYFEVYDPYFKLLGYTTGELFHFLKNQGFSLFRIDQEGRKVAIDTNYVPEKCMNVLGKRITN
jgi:FkbM family methyltransferase